MATVTPNFNWPVPTSTDLVKDGATAIEALGDSIDASMVDLKGGTTGQILSKASNTDMDFSWTTPNPGDITGVTAGTGISGGGTSGDVTITNSMATAIDAKGDLVAGTADNTFSRLAVGTNGQVLTADSTAATGLAWATASAGSTNVAGKNAVLNSQFNVWQRGTSVTGAGGGAYTADRWFLNAGGQITVSRQATGDTTNLPFIQYCARVQRNNGSSDTTNFSFGQSFETINSIPFAGKTISYSFYARKGTNYSSTSNALGVLLTSGTGTDQNKQSAGYTGNVDIINTSITLTNTWQRFTFNGLSVASTATELAPFFSFTPTGTAGAADYYEVTGVQLEIASSASAYSPNTSTQQAELAACQRYYWRAKQDMQFQPISWAMGASSTSTYGWVQPPVTFRAAPTAVEFSSLSLYQGGSAVAAITNVTIGDATQWITNLNLSTASGASANTMYRCMTNANTGYLALSAEL